MGRREEEGREGRKREGGRGKKGMRRKEGTLLQKEKKRPPKERESFTVWKRHKVGSGVEETN